MDKRQIINIINFIRGLEPRPGRNIDLVEPVREQISLMKKYKLKGTFLIQYDAMCDKTYVDMLRGLDSEQFSIGVWFEVVQPLAEKAGLKWQGRWAWDWHAHCGFSVGYSIEDREMLIDILFEDFKARFGYYPKSFGSWAFDAHTLDYATKKYGLDAACNCKEQWGTDGYNLWGGYYGQGYYPSRANALCPAQTLEGQINTPVFRMLGSDPIYQYDSKLDINRTKGSLGIQDVITLEPICKKEGGGIPSWVDWYFSQNYSGNCLSFGYSQAGQENSFGWLNMKDGLEYQFKKISELIEEGKLEAETLEETGKWYKKNFLQTPATTIVSLSDWKENKRRSVWYSSKSYRINLYAENNLFWIRDIYLFKEDYKERYLDGICTTNELLYDNLPLVDGNRFSGKGIRSGLYLLSSEDTKVQGMEYVDMLYAEKDENAIITFTGTPCGDIIFTLTENGIHISKTNNKKALILAFIYDESASGLPSMRQVSDKELEILYREYKYSVKLMNGAFVENNKIYTEENQLFINF
jgi:hypothetical protein